MARSGSPFKGEVGVGVGVGLGVGVGVGLGVGVTEGVGWGAGSAVGEAVGPSEEHPLIARAAASARSTRVLATEAL